LGEGKARGEEEEAYLKDADRIPSSLKEQSGAHVQEGRQEGVID